MPERFDDYASEYESLLATSVRSSGEGPDYFAEYKARLIQTKSKASSILDYGCGMGLLTRHLVPLYAEVHGYDPSSKSIAIARERVPGATFFDRKGTLAPNRYGAIVIANVLHHVPVNERRELLGKITKLLAPRGTLFVFEHNLLNPLTRAAVKACAFDDDAVLLGPYELPRLLRTAGLRDVRREFVVFFPRALAFLRALEPRLKRLPLGAQMFAHGIRAH
jgi:SAM-dependent methyltransferase